MTTLETKKQAENMTSDLTVKILGDSTFEYRETINATNSFGGSIKQDAVVKVKFLQDDPSEVTNWSILDVQFLER